MDGGPRADEGLEGDASALDAGLDEDATPRPERDAGALQPLVVRETTKPLTGAALDALVRLDPLSGEMRFDSTADLPELEVGDVINGGVCAAAPHGFLQKIEAIHAEDGGLRLETRPAGLEEAIESGSLRLRIELEAEEIAAAKIHREGVRLERADKERLGFAFYAGLDDVVLVDADGDPATQDDQLRMSGNIGLSPGMEFDVDVVFGVPIGIYIGTYTDVSGALTLSGELEASFREEITLATWTLTPVSVPLGPLMLVFIPTVELTVGASGAVEARAVFALSGEAGFDVGLGYRDGEWGFHGEETHALEAPEPILTGAMDARAKAGARLSVLLYGLAGAYGHADLYARVAADTEAAPWWEVGAGLDVFLGIDILGFDEEKQVFDPYWPLRWAEGRFEDEPPAEPGWARTLRYDELVLHDDLMGAAALPDGGFYGVGRVDASGLLLRAARDGALRWAQSFEGEMIELRAALARPDQGLVAAGDEGGAGLVMAVDEAGAFEWGTRVLPASVDHPLRFEAIAPRRGGGAFVGALTTDTQTLDEAVDLLLFDAQGGLERAVRLEQPGGELLMAGLEALVPHEGGGVYAVGSSGLFPVAWIVRLDAAGEVEWSRGFTLTMPDGSQMYAGVDAATSDGRGGLVLAGNAALRRSPFSYIARVDASGDVAWVRAFNLEAAAGEEIKMAALARGATGSLTAVGTWGAPNEVGSNEHDAAALRFGPDGRLRLVTRLVGDAHWDDLSAVAPRADGAGAFLLGSSRSAAPSGSDAMIVYLPKLGDLTLEAALAVQRPELTFSEEYGHQPEAHAAQAREITYEVEPFSPTLVPFEAAVNPL